MNHSSATINQLIQYDFLAAMDTGDHVSNYPNVAAQSTSMKYIRKKYLLDIRIFSFLS
jgi:hypothetical protein